MSFKPGPKANSQIARSEAKVEGLRAGMMAIDKALGKSIPEIAKDFGVTRADVKRYITEAEESGFVDHLRLTAFERLAGKALAVYDARLDMGDLDAAKDIAFGLGILKKDNKPIGDSKKVVDTLAAYRQQREKENENAEIVESEGSNEVLHN